MEDRPCSTGDSLNADTDTIAQSMETLEMTEVWTDTGPYPFFLALLKPPQVLLSLSLICLAILTVSFSLIWVSLRISRHSHHKLSFGLCLAFCMEAPRFCLYRTEMKASTGP